LSGSKSVHLLKLLAIWAWISNSTDAPFRDFPDDKSTENPSE
jgi:hypothetical protein